MKPKQKEMDGILDKIYNSFTPKDRTLMVICGDHGMNDVKLKLHLDLTHRPGITADLLPARHQQYIPT